jgi:hypothetical protein
VYYGGVFMYSREVKLLFCITSFGKWQLCLLTMQMMAEELAHHL